MSAQRDHHFDLVVIGSGPAGHKAAIQGAKAKKSVLVIERARHIGGECVRHGTIPSKTLRATAVQIDAVRERLGHVGKLELSEDVRIASLMTRLREVTCAHDGYLSGQLERNGVEQRHGRARFLSPHEVEIEGVHGDRKRVTADRFVLAVGSRPRTPDDVPIDHENIFDSDSWLSLNYLPRSLIVLGGGVIASEYATVFASLGVEVTLVDKWPRPLGFLDEELTDRFVRHFEQWRGCRFLGGAKYSKVEFDGVSQVRVEFEDGRVIAADKLLCALGRVANVDGLGLDAAGVQMTERGHVKVDENGRTNLSHIFAAGDVVGPPALASTSSDQGRRAVRTAFDLPSELPADLIPAGIYTIPEISTVGLTPDQARERFGDCVVGEADFQELARAHIDGTTDGYLRLVTGPDGRKLVGAQVFGEGATELVHVAQMALIAEFDVDVFIEAVMNFPTLSEAYRVAAFDVVKQRQAALAAT